MDSHGLRLEHFSRPSWPPRIDDEDGFSPPPAKETELSRNEISLYHAGFPLIIFGDELPAF